MMWHLHSRSQSGARRVPAAVFDFIFTPAAIATAGAAAAEGAAATAATTAATSAASSVLANAGLAASLVGTAVSAAGAYQQGQTAKKVAGYNAETSRNNAIITEQAAASDSDRRDRQTRQQIASGIAAAGASGIDPNSGSPLQVVADLAGQAKLDDELARWQARERAKGFTNQATLDVYSGRNAATAGTINAGGSILSGFGRAAGMFSGRRGEG